MFNEIGLKIEATNPNRHHRNLSRRIMKLSEELGEISEAYLNVTSEINAKQKTWDDVREELVDLIIVAYDCALTPMPDQEDFSLEEIQLELDSWVDEKLAKWRKGRIANDE